MWRNYLTVGIRRLARDKTYAFINIFGLAVGIAAFLMILLYVRYEMSYDSWVPDSERVYQLQAASQNPDTGEITRGQLTPFAAGRSLARDFPQIESVAYALVSNPSVLRNGEATSADMLFADPSFFDVVQLPFVHGDRTALREANTLVLTESEAVRRFGRANPMGEVLTFVIRGRSYDYRVTGIIRDLPRNSHLRLTMVGHFDPASYFHDRPEFMTTYGWNAGYNYIKLRPGARASDIAAGMAAWERRNIPAETRDGIRYSEADHNDWMLTPLREVHLGPAQFNAIAPGNDRATLLTFSISALLILAMACVNFTNLATAGASRRAREVALRKVVGARRIQLIAQFIGESLLVVMLAMLLALTMLELALPYLAAWLDAELRLNYFGPDGMLPHVLTIVLAVGVAGGLYPALVLSRLRPGTILRSHQGSAGGTSGARLRNILVTGQFAVSIGLMICTGIIYAQTLYARTSDPGFSRDGLLQIANIRQRPEIAPLLHEIERIPGVRSVGRTRIGVSTPDASDTSVLIPGRSDPVTLGTYAVDPGFFGTMGLRLLAGRGFSDRFAMDNAETPTPEVPAVEQALVHRGINIVVNESGARRLGFDRPDAAIGRSVRAAMGDAERYGMMPATIVGVVSDARFRSLHDPIEPIMFRDDAGSVRWLLVRLDGTRPPLAVRNDIERVWRRIVPDAPFEAAFADDIVRGLYAIEQARFRLFAAFATLAILIACLGLYGLAAFTAERRTKEIGIRKVLGARSRDVVRLLGLQFSKPVIVANLIAWPIAWLVMRDWLNGFVDRITLHPAWFLGAGLVAFLIAFLTVAGHALRISRINPVHALRYE